MESFLMSIKIKEIGERGRRPPHLYILSPEREKENSITQLFSIQ
jgi:hypothetical protein